MGVEKYNSTNWWLPVVPAGPWSSGPLFIPTHSRDRRLGSLSKPQRHALLGFFSGKTPFLMMLNLQVSHLLIPQQPLISTAYGLVL